MQNEPIIVYGDGEQSRDFTYIEDIVAANLAAMEQGRPGASYNLGGGVHATVNEVLATPGRLIGKQGRVYYYPRQRGDAAHTAAEITAARTELGFEPGMTLEDGLCEEVNWLSEQFISGQYGV